MELQKFQYSKNIVHDIFTKRAIRKMKIKCVPLVEKHDLNISKFYSNLMTARSSLEHHQSVIGFFIS